MTGIQGLGAIPGLEQLAAGGAARGFSGVPSGPGGAGRSQLQAIKNDEGKSLLDIKDELKSAVSDALASSDGGDIQATVQSAIDSTLEANGFDPQEVKSAIGGIRGGSPFGGSGGLGSFGGLGGAGGFDPSAFTSGAGVEDDLVQSFLQQFRAGVNLDLEI